MPGLRQRAGDLVRRVRGRIRPRPVILCYHRVARLEADPQLLAVRPDRFDAQMEVLRQVAEPVPLDRLVDERSASVVSSRAVAVTFDDGYADNLHQAKPILERHGVPATVFVVAGMVGSHREFWWDELERLVLGSTEPTGDLEIQLGDRRIRWRRHPTNSDLVSGGSTDGWTVLDTTDPSPLHALYRELVVAFRSMRPDGQNEAMEVLRSWAGSDGVGRSSHRVMTPFELASLVDGGLVRVGSHSMHHIRHHGLSTEERLSELGESKTTLEGATGTTIDQFAYPFGDPTCLPANDERELSDIGYQLACANFEGTVGASSNRFRLPRFLVRNWSGAQLRHRLERWFGERENRPG